MGRAAKCRNVIKHTAWPCASSLAGTGRYTLRTGVIPRGFHPACLSPLHGISAGSSPLPHPCAESPAPWQLSDCSPSSFILRQPQLAENCHPGAGLWLCSQHLAGGSCLGLCSVEWRNAEVMSGWHQHLALVCALL